MLVNGPGEEKLYLPEQESSLQITKEGYDLDSWQDVASEAPNEVAPFEDHLVLIVTLL